MTVHWYQCSPSTYLNLFQVDLPIHFTSGATVLVIFTGEGYDPKQVENGVKRCYENTSVG